MLSSRIRALLFLSALHISLAFQHGIFSEIQNYEADFQVGAQGNPLTLDDFVTDKDVENVLGCKDSGVSIALCSTSSVLDVAWNLKARWFVKAALYSGLAKTLKTQSPITVFVPSNAAFAKLPLPLHLYLLTHPNVLRHLLQYHIVAGSYSSEKLFDEETLVSELKNLTLRYNIYQHDEGANTETIQGALVSLFDQVASNGYVHIVDEVIIKVAESNVYDKLQQSTEYSSFFTGVVVAGLDNALKSLSQGTVFAPTNKAISNLPDGTWAGLLNNKTALKDVISLHISPNGVFFSEGVREGDLIPTLNKRNQLTVHVDAKGQVLVNNIGIVWSDEGASNGIIDGLDGLLMPAR